mmetsp:Transcript_5346/g.16854  ORF Transcript_5346/g.16854 Transcript_5346/m.16854 type:complete len:183 (-) Transcript_5346:38-586(-)
MKCFCACDRICGSVRVGMNRAMVVHCRPCASMSARNSACSSSDQRPLLVLGFLLGLGLAEVAPGGGEVERVRRCAEVAVAAEVGGGGEVGAAAASRAMSVESLFASSTAATALNKLNGSCSAVCPTVLAKSFFILLGASQRSFFACTYVAWWQDFTSDHAILEASLCKKLYHCSSKSDGENS